MSRIPAFYIDGQRVCRIVAFLILALLITTRVNAAVIRVNGATGADSNNGSTWQLAKKTVTAALTASASGDDIWVAAGKYVECITLNEGVELFGGFNGTETSRDQRNWRTNLSILDGKHGGTVVTSPPGGPPGETNAARIDGFVILNGNGTWGGGIYCSSSNPTITNNTITANSTLYDGGGIYCLDSSPTITNNTITANNGGGISCNNSSNPTITNNTITANSGGGIYCSGSSPIITNNTITANRTTSTGGGISCVNSSSAITNNIVAFNSSGIFKGLGSATPGLRNNCVYGNTAYNYSGLTAGTGDISVDPKLVAWQWGKLHIQPDSPCRDAGFDPAVGTGWVDMDSQARVQGAYTDIGADESDGTLWSDVPGIVYVKTDGSDSNDGSSWAQAKQTLQAGIDTATVIGAQVWVKAGVYNGLISLKPYVELYGGFNGAETALSQRNWTVNVTILDGQQGGSVVTVSSAMAAARIDGFTIQNGKATSGGGIYCSYSNPAIINNNITANSGGGISCNNSSNPSITNNTVTANIANSGGGIYCVNSSPTITNNTITANSVTSNGGGISCVDSSPAITNNIVAFNSSGVHKKSGSGTPVLRNNCIFGNTSYSYSGLTDGVGDISVDPKLVAWQWGKVHIQPDSLCRDAGYDAAVGTDWVDMDGQARVLGAHVDIGADESDGTLWPALVPGIVYVKKDGSDSNDGSSWALAKQTVQAGIDAANVIGAQVWVKAGVHHQRITLLPYVELYGGFNGTETALSQRSLTANPTILDGQQGGSVVTVSSANAVARIDGLTIRNGKAGSGGGIYCWSSSPNIANNTITANSGGGISCNYSSNPTITNNTITANGDDGLYCEYSNATITNNTITANSRCGIVFYASNLNIINNIVAVNWSGIYKFSGSAFPVLQNNCVHGNTVYNYSGLSSGPGDISVNPLFFNAAEGDFHLQPGSPCINAGDNSVVQQGWEDMDGEARIFPTGGTVDIGADEFSAAIVHSAGEAKVKSELTSVAMQNVVVSASYSNIFYIQPANHTSGIRVQKPGHTLSVGQILSLLGTVRTNANAERYIDATSIAASGTDPVFPMKMNVRTAGGTTLGSLPLGQAGITGGKGLNTVGALVSLSGKVTAIAPDRSWVCIWDGTSWGSSLQDPDGNVGIRCNAPAMLPAVVVVGKMVTVTGPVSLVKIEDAIFPQVLCRSSEDIVVH